MDRREYAACSHKQRPTTTAIIVDKGFLDTITKDAKILPLFEEKIQKYKYLKNFSFQNNKQLKCRWDEFRNTRKQKIPFNFPGAKDLHFVKNAVVLEPKENVNNRENHRFHLRCGPGTDKFGEIPIPDDMHLRKTEPTDKKTRKNVVNKARKKN